MTAYFCIEAELSIFRSVSRGVPRISWYRSPRPPATVVEGISDKTSTLAITPLGFRSFQDFESENECPTYTSAAVVKKTKG